MNEKHTGEPDIVTQNRDELAYLLTEAAEIEHGLMCCYLFAAYSLKRGEVDGLSPADAAMIARWRGAMIDVAIDEMLHLALVTNVLTAIGSAPHFERPNFPVAAGYHPAGVVVALAPFSVATMDHFVFLERPEGVVAPDGAGFEPPLRYERSVDADRLVPSAQDYATVGHLYRGIRKGLEHLAATLGEGRLFVGDPAAQVGRDLAQFDGIVAVTDLASAVRAIDTIVEQGEGSPTNHEKSHYRRFVAVRDELHATLTARPDFAPAHPVARNPVMRRPPIPENRVYVDEPSTARVLDFGNAVYAFALRCLARAFGESEDPAAARKALIEASFSAMRDLGPIMQLLARMPASRAHPGTTAGLTFSMQRATVGFTQQKAAWALVTERAAEIESAAARLAREIDASLARIGEDFRMLGANLARVAPSPRSAAPIEPPRAPPPVFTDAAPPSKGAIEPPPQSQIVIEEARTDRIALRFEGKRCIHSRQCVLGAPSVFLANVVGPWLHPETVTPERVVEIAHACPSGAITYERLDGGAQEAPPDVNVARVRENGPLAFHGELEIEGRGRMFRATLCRCGASKNKPFCDGSHHAAPFVASGEPETRPSDPLPKRSGRLRVLPTQNGPLQIDGSVEIVSGTGRTVDRVTSARLCRCGGSSKKPFCDGTHARIGFVAS